MKNTGSRWHQLIEHGQWLGAGGRSGLHSASLTLRARLAHHRFDILSDNGVRAQGSPELMQVWSGKSAK